MIPRQVVTARSLLWWLNLAVLAAALWVILYRFLSLYDYLQPLAVVLGALARLMRPVVGNGLSIVGENIVAGGQEIHLSMILRPELIVGLLVWLIVIRIATLRQALHLVATLAFAVCLYASMTLWLATTDLYAVLDDVPWRVSAIVGATIIIGFASRALLLRQFNLRTLGLVYGLALAGFLVYGGVVWVTAPPRQTGVIWIDETHGQWEPAAGVIDTLSYGRQTQYNYILLRQWLERHYTVKVITGDFPDTLTCDVFIIKIPTHRYSDHESETIRRYVTEGGTLLVVGDHTNLFGSTTIANELLAPYGVSFRSDATIPFQGREYRYSPAWWSSSLGLNSLRQIDFQTSCTVRSNKLGATPLIVAGSAVAERAVYSNDRFFGDLSITSDDRRSPFALSACVAYGQGLVILFGDSTIWSSFCFFTPPYKELLDQLIQIAITRPDRLSWWALLIGSVTGLLALILGRGDRITSCVSAVLLFAAGQLAVSGFIWAHIPPEETGEASRVVVDTRYSRPDLSTDIRTGSDLDLKTYSAFFALWPRIGVWPEFQKADYKSLDSGAIVAIVEPVSEPGHSETDKIQRFIRRGGTLLLILDAETTWPPPGVELLKQVGADLKLEVITEEWARPAGQALPTTILGLPFSLLYAPRLEQDTGRYLASTLQPVLLGVEPLLVDEHGLCVFGRLKLGRGQVYAFTRGRLLSQYVMGDVWGGIEPDQFRSDLYRLSYEIISTVRNGPVDRKAKLPNEPE